jgi:hypothetical protein
MIDSAEFVNVNGDSIALNDNDIPFRSLDTYVDYRSEDIEKQRDHGLFPVETYLGKRIFEIEGDILQATAGDYITKRRALQRVLMPYPNLGERKIGDLYLELTDAAERMYAEVTLEGRPSLPITALAPARGNYQVIFKAHDPRLYGETLRTQNVEYTTSDLGFTFPLTFPLTFDEGSQTGAENLLNDGDFETYPITTVYGPLPASWELQLLDPLGVKIINFTSLPLTSDQSVVINHRARTAILNGTTNVYNNAIGSDWWALPVGTTGVRLYAYAADPPAKATVTWRYAYML